MLSSWVGHQSTRSLGWFHDNRRRFDCPCIVPVLIHVTIGLRGVPWKEWSGVDEIRFVSALSDASVALGGEDAFLPGDVNVLLAIPWVLEENNPENIGTISKSPVGTKVVIEVSVFNTIRSLMNGSKNQTMSAPLEFLRNFTGQLSPRPPMAICDPNQMFSLAKKVLGTKAKVFDNDAFMPSLVHILERMERSEMGKFHLFRSLYQQTTNEGTGRVISSWTIQTAVDKTVNRWVSSNITYVMEDNQSSVRFIYFLQGPPRPLWHRLLSFVHVLLIFHVFLLMVTSFWNLLVSTFEYAGGRGWLSICRLFAIHRYTTLPETDSSIEDQVMGVEVELTNKPDTLGSSILQQRRGTTATKRKTLGA